ncbi:MAG: hypothetical protein ACRDK8_12375 [Solirubrobacteraceae bacterium]
MRAYKVLCDGRSAFTGWAWPLPSGDGPGDWVQVAGEIGLCENGIHAASTAQLPQWLGDEIWEAELDGEVIRTEPALVAARARLIRRVDAWDERARLAFCEDCAGRARDTATRYPAGAEIYGAKVEPFTGRGIAAAVGYWTALLTAEAATGRRAGADYDRAFARERAAQADWLRRELALED